MDCNGCVQKIKKALYGINGELNESGFFVFVVFQTVVSSSSIS